MPFGVIELHARLRERREYPTVGGRAPGCITWLRAQARVPHVILGRGPRESGGATTSLQYAQLKLVPHLGQGAVFSWSLINGCVRPGGRGTLRCSPRAQGLRGLPPPKLGV